MSARLRCEVARFQFGGTARDSAHVGLGSRARAGDTNRAGRRLHATPRRRAAQALYRQQCASCHGDKLEGVQGPPLTADVFLSRWQAQPLSDLANKIRNTMPAGSPGSLTPQQSADLVAHILKSRQLSPRARPSWRRTKPR